MIWCVEDDDSTREIEVYALNNTGFEAIGFEDGTSLWEALQKERPDLVVLDVMLPGVNGMELLSRMKQSTEFFDIPVIMATAKGQEYDKVKGLDLGADDYLAKPFGVMELVSRVKAVLRRCKPKQVPRLLQTGNLLLNTEERTVQIAGERIMLTYKEFELLQLFLSHPGTAFPREQIFERVWNADFLGDSRTLDMHIRTLRQKLGEYGHCIETVRHIGYRWEPSV